MQEWADLDWRSPQQELEILGATARHMQEQYFALSPLATAAAVGAAHEVFHFRLGQQHSPDSPEHLRAIRRVAEPQVAVKHAAAVRCVIWHPTATAVASACEDGTICTTML